MKRLDRRDKRERLTPPARSAAYLRDHAALGWHPFMQFSAWMGHAQYTLTLDTYGDWIPSQDGGALNKLPAPAPATATPATATSLR